MLRALIWLGLMTVAHSASASTISISAFSASSYTSLRAGFSNVVSEDFESFAVGNVAQGFATGVGTFATLGGTGNGGTVTGANFANDGSLLAIRDGDVFGRVSTTQDLTGSAADDQFLDSNDTFGIAWSASLANGAMFDRLILTLTDAADTGASLRVVDNTGATATLSQAPNASQQVVFVDFGQYVSAADIFFENRRNNGRLTNDGFSLDDIALSTRELEGDTGGVSPVPLPAGVYLLITALGTLVVARRRSLIH